MTFDGTINFATLLTALGFLAGGLWFLWSQIQKAKRDAELKAEAAAGLAQLAEKRLDEYKTHVAETYATKSGLNDSLNRVHDALDRLTDRIDTLLGQQPPKARPRRSSSPNGE